VSTRLSLQWLQQSIGIAYSEIKIFNLFLVNCQPSPNYSIPTMLFYLHLQLTICSRLFFASGSLSISAALAWLSPWPHVSFSFIRSWPITFSSRGRGTISYIRWVYKSNRLKFSRFLAFLWQVRLPFASTLLTWFRFRATFALRIRSRSWYEIW